MKESTTELLFLKIQLQKEKRNIFSYISLKITRMNYNKYELNEWMSINDTYNILRLINKQTKQKEVPLYIIKKNNYM
jgi:hypothetical protein